MAGEKANEFPKRLFVVEPGESKARIAYNAAGDAEARSVGQIAVYELVEVKETSALEALTV